MNQPNDIRWHQRLQNFQSAFNELDEAVALSNERGLSKLEEQGLIQAFEYTYELAWNTSRTSTKTKAKPASRAAGMPYAWRLSGV